MSRTHYYEEQVPYVVQKPVERIVTRRHMAKKLVYDEELKREVTKEVPVTETESHWESVAVTEYQMKSRDYDYRAESHRRELELHARVQLEAQGSGNSFVKLEWPFDRNLVEEGDSHQADLPAIGLSPKSFSYTPARNWAESTSPELVLKIIGDLRAEWRSRFCSEAGLAVTGAAAYADALFRCARIAGAPADNPGLPAAIDAWLTQNWGVSLDELQVALGH